MSHDEGDRNPPRRGEQLFPTLLGPRRPPLVSSAAAGTDCTGMRPRSNLRWLMVAVSILAVASWWQWPGRREQAGDGMVSSRDRGGAEVSGDPDSRPRVAVCFFGLTRSLRWTLPSLQTRLLKVLEQEGMRVDVFVHTYSLAEVNNERAGEQGVEYEPFVNDFQALKPTRSLVTNQDDFDLIWPDPLSLTYFKWIYPPAGAGDIIRNVMRAYWSMSLVWGLMAEHAVEGGFEYEAVVLARPDVWFHYDVNISSRMFPLPERTVFLPSFDNDDLSKMRRNDRFAYGSVTTMRVVMNRIATLLEADAGKHPGGIDSEWVLGHHLRQHQISAKMLDLLVTRVRLTRDIPKFDERLVEEACRSGQDPTACTIKDAGFKFPAVGGAS